MREDVDTRAFTFKAAAIGSLGVCVCVRACVWVLCVVAACAASVSLGLARRAWAVSRRAWAHDITTHVTKHTASSLPRQPLIPKDVGLTYRDHTSHQHTWALTLDIPNAQ